MHSLLWPLLLFSDYYNMVILFQIKEVAPQHTTTDSTRDFWSQDIQVVKESYSTSKGPQSMQLAAQARKLLEDWKVSRVKLIEKIYIYLIICMWKKPNLMFLTSGSKYCGKDMEVT